jgi:hypothetical protein
MSGFVPCILGFCLFSRSIPALVWHLFFAEKNGRVGVVLVVFAGHRVVGVGVVKPVDNLERPRGGWSSLQVTGLFGEVLDCRASFSTP